MLRLLVALILIPTVALAETWRVDLDQTEIKTEVTYLGRIKLGVEFTRFAAALRFEEANVEATRAEIAVATASAETGLGWIDNLITSDGYLDAAGHPDIRFRLNRLEQTSRSTAVLSGEIDLLGVTQPLTLDATVFKYGPRDDDPTVKEAGFTVRGEIDRRDFGNVTGYPDVGARLPLSIRLVLTTAGE
ncbi:MAG: YceI family protein [Pseudomonadota bacterium]